MAEKKDIRPTKKPDRSAGTRSRGRRIWTTIKWILIAGFTFCLFAGGILLGYVSSIVKDEPVRSRAEIVKSIDENAVTGFAYFSDASPIGQLRTEEDRRLVTFDQIPQSVINAIISIEDNRFYEHMGVDMNGTLRAVKQKVLNESVQTGGSTLTQQLARRVFLSADKTNDRKIKEMLLSMRIERFLTKDEILTAYLNKMPFGKGSSGYNIFGIKAAAKGIFGINDLNEVNIAEAAYMAGLPQLPTAYSAFNSGGSFNEAGFKRAVERQQLVLKRMNELGKITNQQYREALAFDIKGALAKPTSKAYSTYPYLMMETERQGAQILLKLNNPDLDKAKVSSQEYNELLEESRQKLLTGGYRVYTTINKTVYNTMHEIAADSSNFSPDSSSKGKEQTAAMMINHKTGAILGMIEGRSFQEEQMNYATQMTRQPGSTMKPIAAYLPGLDSGAVQPASILDDAPLIMENGSRGYHIPGNANGRYQGLVTARTALNESLNLPALKVFNQKVGIAKAWAFAKKLGITTITQDDYSAQTGVLGGLKYGVTVEELTNAYGSIPNQGVFNDSYMISKIVDPYGNVVYQHKAEPTRVYSKQTAYLMTDMLRTVISGSDGTGRSLQSLFNKYGKIPIAGKTGSTQNYADVWFMGFTPDVTLGVWAGYREPVNTLSEDGKKRARTLWATIMNRVTDSDPELFKTDSFTKPDGIVTQTVSGYSGKLPTSATRRSGKLVTDIFNAKFVPKDFDDGVSYAKYITYNGVNYIPQDSTPDDMVNQRTVVKREMPISQLIKDLQKALSRSSGARYSLSHYLPEDAGADAPTAVDPRRDDGSAPAAPSNVRISISGGSASITFNSSGSADVVGYRLYRSTGGGSYQYQKSIQLGSNYFSSSVPGDGASSFYVTAVDVGGHESASSGAVSYSPVPVEEEVVPDDQPMEGSELGDGSADENDGEQSDKPSDDGGAPETPSSLSVQSGGSGIANLTWKASSKTTTSYKVYFSHSSGGPYSLVGDVKDPAYQYNTGTKIKGFFYVVAVNGDQSSAPSSAVAYKE
ncbi:transglycosylase domain-containing protein [Paenibacillus shenyangensis]|uniref:transglycosylase domain-containing protein n=1 Tax=Paenibacillus sp. A9 TaxID=1284352 RepID=UPI0003824368|nr:transglycosylase domain-containing protein [Paenibacillus sp. A9]